MNEPIDLLMLSEQYSDTEWRQKFLRILDSITLLRHCIIDSRYKVSDAMNRCIVLSDSGAEIQRRLNAKERSLNPKDARLACFLEIAQQEPMMDVIKTDIEGLIEEISRQICDGSIKYPLVFGRDLYDRAADMFPDLRARLNAQETMRLLEGFPCGVFQVRNLVTGPFGIVESCQQRWFPPTTRVPLQHCPEISCQTVHETWLSTDHDAPINQALPKLARELDKDAGPSQVWSEFVRAVTEGIDEEYDDFDLAALPIVLGDCLTLQELRDLAFWLHEGVDDYRLREVFRTKGFGHDTERKLQNANRGELLQLCWVATDRQLYDALDALIRVHKIRISDMEIRRARINQARSGAFGVHIELGSLGVRTVPNQPDLPLLRFNRLVTQVYDLTQQNDETDLDWLLRGSSGTSVESRLANYLRTTDPAEAVSSLILWRRSNVDRAFTKLMMSQDHFKDPEDPTSTRDIPDDILVKKILWKLGFQQAELASTTRDFWVRYRELAQQLRDVNPNHASSIDTTKSAAHLMFRELEGVLTDSIEYTCWALTNDHPSAEDPFVYKASQGAAAYKQLTEWWTVNGDQSLRLNGALTLYPLVRSFQALGVYLSNLRDKRSEFQRIDNDKPRYAGRTDLQRFPFDSVHLFLDLLPDAQRTILDGLNSVTEILIRADVSSVRNDVSHFRRSPLELERLDAAMEATRRAVEKMEALGLTRMMFWSVGNHKDRWGHITHHLRASDNSEFSILRPSPYQWVGFPRLTEPQYLFRSAKFAEPNEVLRFGLGYETEFAAMWSNYPRRRRGTESEFNTELESAGDVARSTHRVLPVKR